MPQHTCTRGHKWHVDADATAPALCPECGQTPASVAEAVTVGVERGSEDSPGATQMIGQFEILGELGRGGMGIVYKARDRKLDRIVAVKMLLSGAFATEAELQRFHAEAIAIAHLNHPNIVALHMVGSTGPNDLPFLVLDYCPGGSLADKIGKPWSARDAALLVESLARAVAAAHDKGIVHRDLKPGNVLLDEHGQPKITDFGLARRMTDVRQTTTGAIMGTPAYMSPEQASGKTAEVGQASDIWALGVLFYELLTGQVPFRANTPTDTLIRIVSDEPASPRKLVPALSRDLDTICLKCLAKQPEKRYLSAAELADDLKRFLSGEAINARPRRWWQRLSRRQRGWLTTGGIAALAAFVVAGLLVAIGSVSYFRYQAYGEQWKKSAHHRDRKEYDKAIAALDEANRLIPHEIDPFIQRSWLYQQKGDNERALELLDQAERLSSKHPGVYKQRGAVLVRMKRYEEAIADYKNLIELEPGVASHHRNRGVAYLYLRRWNELEADMDRVLALDSKMKDAYDLRAIGRAAQGRYRECISDTWGYSLGSVNGGRATIFVSIAAASFASGDRKTYLESLDPLLRLAEVEHEPYACISAARVCLFEEKSDVPTTRLQGLIDVGLLASPKYNFYQRVQGQLWLRTGQTEKALEQFTTLTKEHPAYSPGITQLLLALALHKLGKSAGARAAYEEAQKEGVPVIHLHEALEYQILLKETRRALDKTDTPAP